MACAVALLTKEIAGQQLYQTYTNSEKGAEQGAVTGTDIKTLIFQALTISARANNRLADM